MKKLIAILFFTLLSTPSFALLQADLKIDGQNISFLIDPYKTVQLEGLPYQGIHLYSIMSDTLYIQHPDEPKWLALPLGTLDKILPQVHMEKGNQSGEFLGEPNRHWAVRVGENICDHIFTNQEVYKRTGLTISHLSRVAVGLQYVYGNLENLNVCDAYAVPTAVGQVVGFPVHSSGHGGEMDVLRLITIAGKRLPQPEEYELFSTAAKVRFLKRQLSPDVLRTFEKTKKNLPLEQQLRALRRLVTQN